MFEQIVSGFSAMLTPTTILLTFAGVVLGTVLGAIPGLTSTMGIALILPLTFYLEPIAGIVMLTAMYKGGLFGGSISAIMFNAPGTAAAAATSLDGYPLTKKGLPRKALRTALVASTTGDIVGNLVLIFISASLASIALKFGPAEYTMLIIFALIMMIAISQDKIIKTLISTLFGLSLATIGSDPETSIPRFDFGLVDLSGGISIIALVIGLLAVSEVFLTIENYFITKLKPRSTKEVDTSLNSKEEDKLTLKEILGIKRTLLRSSTIGTGIGALPGMGPVIAAFIGYGQARKKSKNGDNFGKGEIEGVAAAEAGNSAVASSNLIPLLSLGIPGDAEAALIFGALVIQGIIPGPQVFETNGEIVYGIFAGMLMASLLCLVFNWYMINFYRKITYVKPTVLAPIILVLCIAGTYGYSQASFDIIVMFAFGILGFLLRKLNFPTIGIIIGFVLGPKLEESFRQSMVLSNNSLKIFITEPIALALLIISALIMISSFYKIMKNKKASTN